VASREFVTDDAGTSGNAGERREPDTGLAAFAEHEQRWVERLLTHAEERGRGFPFARGDDLGDLARSWSPRVRDPEFRKNLRIFGWLIRAAACLYDRAAERFASNDSEVRRQAGTVLAREEELRGRIELPKDQPLTLTVLLARRFELEQLLIDLGDREYLTGRLAELYDEGEATHATWRNLFGNELPPLLPGPVGPRATGTGGGASGESGRLDSDEVESTRGRMARLMHVKEAQDRVARARWELRQPVVWMVAGVLAVVTAAFGATVAWMVADDPAPGGRVVLAAATAGATGAALGGLFRLRDEVRLGTEVRRFLPFFVGGVFVGAAAGLVAFLVHQAGIVAIAGDGAGVAAVAFAVGFSEAAFVGLLARITGPAEPSRS